MSDGLTIYVTGDSGTDCLTWSERGDLNLSFPAGASFVFQVLEKLLPGVRVSLLARLEEESAGRETLTALCPVRIQIERYQQKENNTKVRISKIEKTTSVDVRNSIDFSLINTENQKLLVIHDGDGQWSKKQFGRELFKFIEQFRAVGDNLSVLVNVKEVPIVENEQDHTKSEFKFQSNFWNKLLVDMKHNVGIVISLATLRRGGAAISRGLSWEQTVEDLMAELHLFPGLKALSQFRHLFVRADLVGLIHIERNPANVDRVGHSLCGTIYFAPYARYGIHRNPDLEGRVVGKNSLVIGSLADQIRNGKDFPGRAIESAIRRVMAADDKGYADDILKGKDVAADGLIESFTSNANQAVDTVVVRRDIPNYLLAPPLPGESRSTKRWHVLNEALEQAPVHRINVAIAIVKAGHEQVLNRPWSGPQRSEIWEILTRRERWNPQDRAPDYVTLEEGDRPAMPEQTGKKVPVIPHELPADPFAFNVPITRFGRLTIAEREEIEGLSSISRLLQSYIKARKEKQATNLRDRADDWKKNIKPTSIAVFGPPGSGKSFAVKEIAESSGEGEIKIHEINVAQFRNPQQLTSALSVCCALEQGPTPLIFLDEFDCTLDEKPLGWLKYFLAPMQDGKFRSSEERVNSPVSESTRAKSPGETTITIGPAIFVFAGGTHTSFEQFDPRSGSPSELLGDPIYKQKITQFAEQKGPDFLSRLRGHINVLPINAESGQVKHFIRRAIQLRSLLEHHGYLDANKMAKVEEAIVFALLTVDRYRHGTRSMEAILEMCTRIDGGIQIASLPSRAQLEMHVDAEEFLVRIYRGRARAMVR